MKQKFLVLIIGILIGVVISVSAVYVYNAKDINYSSADVNWDVTNVEDAIKDLKDTNDNYECVTGQTVCSTCDTNEGQLFDTRIKNASKFFVILTLASSNYVQEIYYNKAVNENNYYSCSVGGCSFVNATTYFWFNENGFYSHNWGPGNYNINYIICK